MANELYITRYAYSEKPASGQALYLSLFLSPDSFMFAISTNAFNSVHELCHIELTGINLPSHDYKEQVSFLVTNHQLHRQKFAKVNIAILNKEFTLVPQAFSEDANTRLLLEFTGASAGLKTSHQHQVANASFSYSANHELLGYLEKTFTNASIRHAGAVNIALLFGQHSLKNSNLFVNIGTSSLELVAGQNDKLLYYNVFTYESNEDVLYYLLFMMEQFSLNPLQARISIACERPVTDELLKNIKKYIKQVEFCVNDSGIHLQGELAALPSHYYFTLLNQHLCEL